MDEPTTTLSEEHAEDTFERHLESGDSAGMCLLLEMLPTDETIRLLGQLNAEDQGSVLALLDPELAAEIVEAMPETQATAAMEEMEPGAAAGIFAELPDDTETELLRGMDDEESAAIMRHIPGEDAQLLRERVACSPDSAGALMSEQFIAFPAALTVGDVRKSLEAEAEDLSEWAVQYIYVTDEAKRLIGVLRLRDLLLSRRQRVISEIMLPNPLTVPMTATFEQLEAFFRDHHFFGVPVVDGESRLIGILAREAVDWASERRAKNTFLKFSGIVGGEELRNLPLGVRCLRRLSWLVPNILLNMMAASVIAVYEDTLDAVIALAIFLPMVSDMSGCSGNQAVAVSIRELTLGVLRTKDYLRVVLKEGALGIINGTVLGLILGTIATLWKGNIVLGAVIGGALALNTVFSVLLGGLVPLFLKRLRVDPALASAPLLTTCTDMCGFFLVLGLASRVLHHLV